MAWLVRRLRMDERPLIWRVAANIFNKQLRTAEKCGPPVWGLVEALTIPQLKIGLVTKRIHVPRAWTDPLVRPQQWKGDVEFGTWNVKDS
jgi:hypothetical protein